MNRPDPRPSPIARGVLLACLIAATVSCGRRDVLHEGPEGPDGSAPSSDAAPSPPGTVDTMADACPADRCANQPVPPDGGVPPSTGGKACDPLPGAFADNVARVEDGRWIVAIRPEPFTRDEDYRLFIGTADRLVEQRVVDVFRSRRDGSTMFTFVLDGATARAQFPPPRGYNPDPSTPRPALEVAGQTLSLSTLPAGTAPPMFQFFCLR